MVTVVDFDGTLVKENSSRVLENLLMGGSGVLNFVGPLLLVLGKLLGYEGDFRRYVIMNLALKKHGARHLKEAMEKTAERLTVRREFMDKDLIILSSGLLPVITATVRLNNLRVIEVHASRPMIEGNRVVIRELTPEKKGKILEELSRRYGGIVYYTDDPQELRYLAGRGVKVVLVG
jgi:hypothetical protein